jgi:hypothetical protein
LETSDAEMSRVEVNDDKRRDEMISSPPLMLNSLFSCCCGVVSRFGWQKLQLRAAHHRPYVWPEMAGRPYLDQHSPGLRLLWLRPGARGRFLRNEEYL